MIPRNERTYWDKDAPRSLNARAFNAIATSDRCMCGDCGWRGHVTDLAPIASLWERLSPGDNLWDGDCPRCGFGVHNDEQHEAWAQERQQREAAGTMLAALEAALFDLGHRAKCLPQINAAIAAAELAGITPRTEV